MGGDASKQLQQQMRQVDPESHENFIGLENFGNTCYMNSVIQALYWCRPFRSQLLRYADEHPPPPTPADRRGSSNADPAPGGLMHQLCDLFLQLQGNKKRTGCVAPMRLVRRIKQQSEVFSGPQQQDAHEFLTYVLNDLSDTIQGHMKEARKAAGGGQTPNSCSCSDGTAAESERVPKLPQQHTPLPPGTSNGGRPTLQSPNGAAAAEQLPGQPNKSSLSSPDSAGHTAAAPFLAGAADALLTSSASGSTAHASGPAKRPNSSTRTEPEPHTLVQELFEGNLAAETRCLNCDSVTSKEEVFMGLSVDVAPNVSLQRALRNFSCGETMDRDNKFMCDKCRALQEAKRSLRIKRAPPVLAVHLKRFKFIEEHGRHCKLGYRVPFPHELRLPVEGTQSDDVYHLFAVVIHLGMGPNMGHYICMAKTGGHWMLFDDDLVRLISEREVAQVYGVSTQTEASTQTGYLLFYSVEPFAQSSSPTPTAGSHPMEQSSQTSPRRSVPTPPTRRATRSTPRS
eukprot:TRINITY_DN2289_c0_g1_i1.p1 TRINITY_DN2289_c0_g1~~TRINITY_DN2289_c0_g1_i1.p1  ORF type:complete len:512 (+),score=110.57 TRINITY_DN2289_c0_g1_i1:239-1774(+)